MPLPIEWDGSSRANSGVGRHVGLLGSSGSRLELPIGSVANQRGDGGPADTSEADGFRVGCSSRTIEGLAFLEDVPADGMF
jgi:hypothetical protein